MGAEHDTWVNITPIGSVYETQWNPVTGDHRHRPLGLTVEARPDLLWVEGEWIAGLPPGNKGADNDNIDKRLEGAMLTLERTIQEVSATVSAFSRSMGKLWRATQFLFLAFSALGISLLWLAWTSLP